MSAIDIARGLTQLRPDWNIDGPYQFGEIGAVGSHGTNTVDVYLDGSTSLSTGLYYLADYAPQVNDPVMIGRMQGSSQSARVVLGPLAPGGTIHGGPPTSTPYAGARIFDTKYGVTWWWDGSAWHANGPGLIAARLYLTTTYNPGTSILAFDTKSYDPLGMSTTGAGAKITVTLAGRYSVATYVKYGNTTSAGCIYIYKNGVMLYYSGNTPSIAYAGTGISDPGVLLNAGDSLQTVTASSGGQNLQIDEVGGIPFLTVAFVSS